MSQNRSTPVQRPSHLFQPGKSGNPGGRPKGFGRYIREKTGINGERLYDLLFEVAEGRMTVKEIVKQGPNAGAVVDVFPTIRERMDATLALAAYAHGKPTATLEVSGPGGGPVEVSTLDLARYSDAELEQLELLLEKGDRPELPASDEIVEGEVVE